MPQAPPFFVPNAEPGKQEASYAALANLARRMMPDIEVPAVVDGRIYSIAFVHDGEEWTATVGQQLRGNTIADPRARAQKRRFAHPVSDEATVQAIFAGRSYIVVTDSRINPNIRSAWENPFLAGVPRSVTLFDNSADP